MGFIADSGHRKFPVGGHPIRVDGQSNSRPADPGDWQPVTRTFRDGHAQTWWAADARLGWWGPDGFTRLVAVTADPGTLPDKATWYLATNLPRPGSPREEDSPHPAAARNL